MRIKTEGSLYAWIIVSVLMTMYTSSFIDRQILGLLVAPIRTRFNISDLEYSYLTGLSFALLYSIAGIPLGYAVDRWNRKLIIVIGVVFWSIMTAICGVVTSFSALFIARIGVGLGEATLSPATYSLIPDLFPPAKLARALSVFGLGVPIGAGVALVVGGPLVQILSANGAVDVPGVGILAPWQQVFLIIGLPGILLGVLALFIIREPVRKSNTKSPGSAGPTFAEVLNHLWSERAVYVPIFLGFTFVALFWYGAAAWLPAYLQRVQHFSVSEAGLFLGASTLSLGIVGTYAAGWLADAMIARGASDGHFRVVLAFSLGGLLCGSLGVLVPQAWLSQLLIFGYGFFAFTLVGVNAALLQLVTPSAMRGRISAIYLFVLNLISLGLGPTLVAYCTDHIFRDELAVGKSIALVGSMAVAIGCIIILRGWRAVAVKVLECRRTIG